MRAMLEDPQHTAQVPGGPGGYAALRARIRALAEGETETVALMATISCELYNADPRFDWVGFYRVTAPEMLKIGPYQGGHGCLQIPFSRGVCGAAARTGRTLIVPDVEAFEDHIACAASTRSEIVVPVRNRSGKLIAVLDIDSDQVDAFTETDRIELEAMLDEIFTRPPLPAAMPEKPTGLMRLLSEGDVLFGPVLLVAHFVIAAFGWILEQYFSVPFVVTNWEVALSVAIAVTMMLPVFLILRAYYHQKVSPLPTIFYMFGHAGLIIVGYAGIYGMLGYGPAGGFDPADPVTAGDCIPTWERNFYLSAITFTTVGYGDCAPYGVARFFAGIQGVLSVVFVGTTVGLMTGIAPTGGEDERT